MDNGSRLAFSWALVVKKYQQDKRRLISDDWAQIWQQGKYNDTATKKDARNALRRFVTRFFTWGNGFGCFFSLRRSAAFRARFWYIPDCTHPYELLFAPETRRCVLACLRRDVELCGNEWAKKIPWITGGTHYQTLKFICYLMEWARIPEMTFRWQGNALRRFLTHFFASGNGFVCFGGLRPPEAFWARFWRLLLLPNHPHGQLMPETRRSFVARLRSLINEFPVINMRLPGNAPWCSIVSRELCRGCRGAAMTRW